jgi:hypothetical protein
MGDNFAPELKRLLREAGCRFERPGKGDHEIRHSPITEVRFTVDEDQVPPHRQWRPEAS